MAKLAWNSFIDQYDEKYCFGASVRSALPRGLEFDKRGKKLPTPYGLFQEWLIKNLTGDYATTKVKGGFLLSVADKSDAERIAATFKILGAPISTQASNKTHMLDYHDSSYGITAKQLGYALNYA